MDLQKKVQDILDQAVARGTECGCQAALYIHGELAVNAFAGYTDWTRTRKIDADTVFPIYSTGKAPSSTVLHRLVEHGILNYDTRVADIWPEFGCNGKEEIRIWQVLSYRCGLFALPEATADEQADFACMTEKIARMTPAYAPGTKQQYHPVTYGWLIGGIACHALKRSDYAAIFREWVGEPAGMNRFFYGISPAETNAAFLVTGLDGATYSRECVDKMNEPRFRRNCDPSTCTMSNALSIARHYAALDMGTLLRRDTLLNATRSWRGADDPMPLEKGRWELFGLGYVLSGPPDAVGQIFGHGGVGGSEGLLDQKKHYAIAITRNCFADPNVMEKFYAAVDFKNRDWPDSAEIPDQLKATPAPGK